MNEICEESSSTRKQCVDFHLPVRIFGKFMHPSVVLKNSVSGVMFMFTLLISNICKTCFIQKRHLRWVRQYLMDQAAFLAANALLSSRLDYGNSLFRSLSSFNMYKLRCIQNTFARIVTNCNRYSRASPILKQLN